MQKSAISYQKRTPETVWLIVDILSLMSVVRYLGAAES
jgi:hypothetical protein